MYVSDFVVVAQHGYVLLKVFNYRLEVQSVDFLALIHVLCLLHRHLHTWHVWQLLNAQL